MYVLQILIQYVQKQWMGDCAKAERKRASIDGMHRHTHIKIQYMHTHIVDITHGILNSEEWARGDSSERARIESVDEVNIMQQSSNNGKKNARIRCRYVFSIYD